VKDGIEILDTGENPEAPASREMSDLEVTALSLFISLSLSVCACGCLCVRL